MEILSKIPWWGWAIIISWLPVGYLSIINNQAIRPDPYDSARRQGVSNYKFGRGVFTALGLITFFISIPHWLWCGSDREKKKRR